MGRYSVKSKQDLSGIATLTGNPIAVDNIRAVLDKVSQRMAPISGVPKSVFKPKK
ncbi:MAG: hypothetical protein NC411_10435 [Bacteroides sp.]|nr:hypothetical protein [Bacteroides sp.]